MVGLQFVPSAIAQEIEILVDAGRLRQGDGGFPSPECGPADHAQGGERPEKTRLLKHLEPMPGGDMRDFVAQDDRELRLILALRQEPARDENEATRDGKRVQDVRVDNREIIRKLGTVRLFGNALANLVQINLPIQVFIDAVFFDDLHFRFFPDLNFSFLGDELHLAVLGDQILSAGGQAA